MRERSRPTRCRHVDARSLQITPTGPSSRRAAVARRRPIVTGDGRGVRRGSRGLAAPGRPRLRSLRHPGGVPAARRHPARCGTRAGTASTPAASPAARPGGPRSPWPGGSACSSPSARSASRWARSRPTPPPSGPTPDNITYFIGSIFFTTASFLQYYGGRVDADRPRRTASRAASARCCGSGTAASTGGPRSSSCSARCGSTGPRSSALARRAGRVAEPPPDLAARRAGLHLLPRLELAGLGRGVPRAVRLAAVAASRGGSPR